MVRDHQQAKRRALLKCETSPAVAATMPVVVSSPMPGIEISVVDARLDRASISPHVFAEAFSPSSGNAGSGKVHGPGGSAALVRMGASEGVDQPPWRSCVGRRRACCHATAPAIRSRTT
jgi:hypothetical protein